MTEILLHDYVGRPIQWKDRDYYYKNGMMSPESMQAYENYKNNMIKETEKISKIPKSIVNSILEEKNKFLNNLKKIKWGGPDLSLGTK